MKEQLLSLLPEETLTVWNDIITEVDKDLRTEDVIAMLKIKRRPNKK